jgi:hypothetical protein
MNITKGYSGQENVCRRTNPMPELEKFKTEVNNRDTNRHHPDRSFCIATAIENLLCTRRVAATTARFHCAPSVPGLATGTSPRARRCRARKWSRCGSES